VSQVNSIEQRVKQLEAKNATLSADTQALRDSLNQLEGKQSMDEFVHSYDSIAYLTPGSRGYAVVQMDLGRITVSLENVQPYANGSRVTLRFGNLTSARIDGVKATLEWGTVNKQGAPDNDTERSREISLEESLRAGAWTNVPVVLEGVPSVELGFVRVKDVSHHGIVLLR
jgi:Protein of unknown function (DUF3251)